MATASRSSRLRATRSNGASPVPAAVAVPTATSRDGAAPPIVGCTCFRARRLARRMTQIYDRVLAPSGLRVTQYGLLARLLWNGPMAVGALAATLDMDRTTLTRNLKPLIEARLVSLARRDDDARQREARLTALGRTRHDEAKRLWRRAQNEVNRTLGTVEVAALHRLFDGVIDTLDERAGTVAVATRRLAAIDSPHRIAGTSR